MHAESHEYIHHDLNREVTAIGGHYVLTKEVRLPFEGREALYVVGYAISLVEPIHDEAAQREIRQLIERKEVVHQVRFQ